MMTSAALLGDAGPVVACGGLYVMGGPQPVCRAMVGPSRFLLVLVSALSTCNGPKRI